MDRGARYFVGGDRFDALEAAYPIVKGVPELWQSPEQAVVSRVVPRRIRIRHALRGGPWMELDTGRIPFGLLQARIEDRDGNASFLRFARVPAAARIERSACGNERGIIAFTGFEGATLDVCPPSGTTVELRSDTATGRHEVSVAADTEVDAPKLAVELRWPDGGSLRAEVLVLHRQVGIYRADGSPYLNRSGLTIGDLRGGFAASTDQGELIAQLVEPGQYRPVIRQRWAAGPEHRLGAIDARDPSTARTVVPVPYGQGSWLVYVRQDGKLRSRPVLVARERAPHSSQPGALTTLMEIAGPQARAQTLGAAMEQGARADDADLLVEIARLIRSTSGDLPPQTFDPIRLLPAHPAAALRLLAMGEQKDLDTLLALPAELPLSWEWLALDLWCQAFEAEWRALHARLSPLNLAHLADSTVQLRLQQLPEREARLAPHAAIVWCEMDLPAPDRRASRLTEYLRYLQLPAACLKEIVAARARAAAEECVKRNDARRWPGRPSFRPEMVQTLPDFIGTLAGFVHSVLDAPYVAAQVAAGRWPWSDRIERLLRMNRAFDPGYFDEVLAMQIVVAWQAKHQ